MPSDPVPAALAASLSRASQCLYVWEEMRYQQLIEIGDFGRFLQRWLDALPLRRRVVAIVTRQGVPAYLVGGTVRDALLGRRSTDLDLAIEGGAMSVARGVADRIGGAYVPLDAERDVARVVVRVGREQHHFDFAGLRADDIESDLWGRDYTVNAMALRLGTGLGTLIDPTGGQRDLAARLLRVVTRGAFRDDPLRILRGVRLGQELGFALTTESEALAREHAIELRRVSPERIRDELVRILSLEDAADALAYAGALGMMRVILPEIADRRCRELAARRCRELAVDASLLSGAVGALARLEDLFGRWIGEAAVSLSGQRRLVEMMLGGYRAAMAEHWTEELCVGRPRWVMLKLAALLSRVPEGPTVARSVAGRLRFSRQEVRLVSTAVSAADRCLHHVGQRCRFATATGPGRLWIYRYYRDFGDAGLDGALLSLVVGLPGSERSEVGDAWRKQLESVRRLLWAWFDEHDALVEPPRLLTGRDLVQLLAVAPGPRIGQLLEMLREAQVDDVIHTRDQAIDFARAQMAQRGT